MAEANKELARSKALDLLSILNIEEPAVMPKIREDIQKRLSITIKEEDMEKYTPKKASALGKIDDEVSGKIETDKNGKITIHINKKDHKRRQNFSI